MIKNPVSSLVADADGFYPVTLGRIGVNRTGQYIIKPLTTEQLSQLQSRSANGLYGEYGHPSQTSRALGEFAPKFDSVNEARTAILIKDIAGAEIDGEQVITGKFKPAGQHGALIGEFLAKGEGNIVFGMRSIGNVGPDTVSFEVKEVITWDVIHIGV